MSIPALAIYAGPAALRHVHSNGLLPEHVRTIPAAAGGPKGLMLNRLDRFIFGDWLARSSHHVQLVGASVGAWRMAAACTPDPVAAFALLEQGYIHQTWQETKQKPTPQQVSAVFAQQLHDMFAGVEHEVLQHPHWHLHVLVSQGRRLLAKDGKWRSPLGYAAAFASNAIQRKAMQRWLQRLAFSVPQGQLPFGTDDYHTVACELTQPNFYDVMRASGSIPFALEAVQHIAGAPRGACWDGGITDYHLHLNYKPDGIVLYPHFQQAVVPGWLDKSWKKRHASTPALDSVLLLAPNPAWVATLPNGKLPDRHDFITYQFDNRQRIALWSAAVSASQQLADEFAQWLQHPDPSRIQPL